MAHAADSVTQTLQAWLAARFGDAGIALDRSVAEAPGPTIRLALARLRFDTSERRATTLLLSYRITIEAADPLDTHRLAGEVGFALSDLPLLVLDDGEAVPLALDPADDGEPLALLLTARLVRARRAPAAAPVLKPMVLHFSDVGAVEGTVATRDGVPVGDVLIEIPSLDLRQRSRPDGSFRFSGLPGQGPFAVTARKSLAEAQAHARPGERLALTLSAKE